MHNPWNHFLETAIPIPPTPHPEGTFLSAKALGPQIYAALHFWGIFRIYARKLQEPFCAKFRFAFVRVPLDTVRVFLGGEKLSLIKLVPAGRKTLSPEKGEENCKLRETFLLFAQFAPSHLFHPPSLLFKWLDSLHWISRNNWSTPSDNILFGGPFANPATSFRL